MKLTGDAHRGAQIEERILKPMTERKKKKKGNKDRKNINNTGL